MSIEARAREALVSRAFTGGSHNDDEDEAQAVAWSDFGFTATGGWVADNVAEYPVCYRVTRTGGGQDKAHRQFFYAGDHEQLHQEPYRIGGFAPTNDDFLWSAANCMSWEGASSDPDDDPSIEEIEWLLPEVLSLYADRLSADVCELLSHVLPALLDPDEYEEGDSEPDLGSFVDMLDFLAGHPEFRVPRLAVTRRGNFKLSWRASENELASLEFRPDSMANWLVFAPPARGSISPQRAAGETAISEIVNILRSHGAMQWVERA